MDQFFKAKYAKTYNNVAHLGEGLIDETGTLHDVGPNSQTIVTVSQTNSQTIESCHGCTHGRAGQPATESIFSVMLCSWSDVEHMGAEVASEGRIIK